MQDEDNNDDEEDAEGEIIKLEEVQEAPIVIAKSPSCPTREDRDRHYPTHLPYRNWCPACVQARGREDDHKKDKKRSEETVPTVVMDYKSFGQDDDDKNLTALVLRDKKTTTTMGHVCECKGTEDKWIVKKILEDIDEMGHTDIILKTDGEPALVQVATEVKRQSPHSTVLQNPPAYDPAANGVAERAVQEWMGQMRVCKIGLEQRIKTKVETDWRVLEWIAEHAGNTINKFLMGHDGKTPYHRVMGRPSSKAIMEFGEQVLAKPMRSIKSRRKKSLKSKWVFGAWVGATSRSSEHLVVLQDGGAAIKVRTVKRRPEDERWCARAIQDIVAYPRAPNPKDKGQGEVRPERLTRAADPGGGSGEALPDVSIQEPDLRTRDFNITKTLIEKLGTTDGCKGCEGHVMGSRRAHSEACRSRMEAAMKNDEVLGKRVTARDARKIEEACRREEEMSKDDVLGRRVKARDARKPREDEPNQPEEEQGMHAEAYLFGDFPEDEKADQGELEEVKRDRPAHDDAENASKRRRIEDAIGALTKLIHDSKINAKAMKKRRIYDVSRWINEVISEHTSRPTPHEDEDHNMWEALYKDKEFVDDMNGFTFLNKDLTVQARKLEIEYFKKMKVYTKVPRSEALRGGYKIITTKWLDTNKGDDENPNYRSRLVGRELNTEKRLDLFAATPPLETIKFLVAQCAQNQNRRDP